MTFNKMILAAVSASGILLSASTIAPTTFSITTPAHADTNISVNIGLGTFYDRLEPYGNWVSYQDQYVFIPQHVDHGWRPYTLGHWSYTHRYGWLWVSNERFGWATYHYGRWGYSRDIGWYWVPGHRWAPAWVAWSHGHNNVAWAPLPPQRRGNLDVSITIGDVPDYYWQAVPTSAFLSINLSNSIIRDRNQVRTIVQQSSPETVHIENNIVINNVIQVNEIERATNTKVTVLAERPVSSPDAVSKTDPNTVAIFNPSVKVDESAKPKNAVQVQQVITDRKAKGIQPADMPADQPVVPAQTLGKNVQPIPPDVQPAGKEQVPANSKSTNAPTATSNKTAVEPLKPAGSVNAKVVTQGKGDAKKNSDAQPGIIQSAPTDVPVAKQPSAAATPGIKVPALKNPAVNAPIVEAPLAKMKQDKSAVTPPADKGKSPTDLPVNKQKAGDAKVPQDAQKNDQPKQTGQQPKDQNANDKKLKGGQDKGKCDPNVETCSPPQ